MKSEFVNETNWIIDKIHSEIGFKVKHLMIASVKGNFRQFDAQITTWKKDFTRANIFMTIESDSIQTGDRERDEHLISPDFLDALNFAQIFFKSSGVTPSGLKGAHIVQGGLTILGITKPVELNAQFGGIMLDPWGNEKAGFQVTGEIDRRDWGLQWNTRLKTGGFLIGDMVTIQCDLELINATQRAMVRNQEYVLR